MQFEGQYKGRPHAAGHRRTFARDSRRSLPPRVSSRQEVRGGERDVATARGPGEGARARTMMSCWRWPGAPRRPGRVRKSGGGGVAPGLEAAGQLGDDAALYTVVRPLNMAEPRPRWPICWLASSRICTSRSASLARVWVFTSWLARSSSTTASIRTAPSAPHEGAVDPTDWARADAAESAAVLAGARGRKAKAPAPVWARHRLVVTVSDRTKLEGYVGAILAARSAEVLSLARRAGADTAPLGSRGAAHRHRLGMTVVAVLPGGGVVLRCGQLDDSPSWTRAAVAQRRGRRCQARRGAAGPPGGPAARVLRNDAGSRRASRAG